MLAWQGAALQMLKDAKDPLLARRATHVWVERYQTLFSSRAHALPPNDAARLEECTFFTELRRNSTLYGTLWPESMEPAFEKAFREMELRRELLSSMARLGHAFIDLYMLVANQAGTLKARSRTSDETGRALIAAFLNLLQTQSLRPGEFTGFRELSDAAANFDATLPPRVLNSCEWPRPETPDAWVFVTENSSVTAAASDLAINVPTVRLLCTSGTPAASEVAAIARLTLSGWRIAVRADFDSAGLDHVATILTAVPGASPWRMGVADYVDSLQKATQEEIRLQRISDAAWDPELSSVMREKGLAAYEEALLPLLLEDIAAGRPVATIRTGSGALS